MASLIGSILRCFTAKVPPRQLPALTDDLLQEIFLRIGSPADLVRASAACAAFRRLISDRGFLRRYRSRHPPPFLGFLQDGAEAFVPAEAPHPNAAAACALASAADFSFDDWIRRDCGSGTGDHWVPRDVRDGRVLLSKDEAAGRWRGVFTDLAVCDPLSRRCLRLPSVADDDLLASVQANQQSFIPFQAFFVPPGDEDDETSFRVISMMLLGGTLLVFIFCSVSGCWIPGASATLDALQLQGCFHLCNPEYVYGCFYWRWTGRNKLLKLDMRGMEFSTVDIPPGHYIVMEVSIVEAGEGRLGIFSCIRNTSSVRYSIRQSDGERSNGWQMVKKIPLPFYVYQITGTPQGYIFLLGSLQDTGTVQKAWFSIEIKTLKIERVTRDIYCEIHPYFGFPPSLSPRRI